MEQGIQLNVFITYYIQNNGMNYVVDNYIALRNQYYYGF